MTKGPSTAFESETFGQDVSFKLEQPVGSMSISPCGRDVVLASREGLHIIDLDSPWDPPRYLAHHTSWEVADVQWSPFGARDNWVASTSNQKALVWNLDAPASDAVDFVLHGHTRAITDINFSAHDPNVLATCAVDSFVHIWDLNSPQRPAISLSDWFAGATQVKWSRQDPLTTNTCESGINAKAHTPSGQSKLMGRRSMVWIGTDFIRTRS
jgi:WD40 repeat protein